MRRTPPTPPWSRTANACWRCRIASSGIYVFHKGDTTRIANRLYAADDAEFRDRIARHRRHVGGFHARAATQAILGDASLDR